MTDVRQVQVLSIAKGSPADGVLKIDDVILGADGTGAAKVPLFEGADSALMPLADAINEAEARNPAILKLLVWRPEKPASDDNVDPYREVDLQSVEKMLKPYTKGQTMTIYYVATLARYVLVDADDKGPWLFRRHVEHQDREQALVEGVVVAGGGGQHQATLGVH